MLLSAQASRHAHQLLDARAGVRLLPCLSQDNPALTEADGYDVAKSILAIRTAQGEDVVGRKLLFANRALAQKYGVRAPIEAPAWAPLFDSTVRFTEENHGVQSLRGALQPRIEPHLVFRLGKTPPRDADAGAMADCIEWMAPGFEIAICPFPDWRFEAADAIAGFGLHGVLVVGEAKSLSEATRRNLPPVLANASVSLSVSAGNGLSLRAAGFGSDLAGSPVHALALLQRMLQERPQFKPLAAGEIIASGGWTDAYPVEAGQTWTSAFSGVALPGLTLSFV